MANNFTRRLSDNFALRAEHDIRNVHGAPGWIELTTGDPVRAGEFFAAAFGWNVKPMQIGGGDYWVISVKGHDVGGMRRPMPGMPDKPFWASYITVEDVDAAAERALHAGGKICVPVTELPGAGKLVGFEHPQGGQMMAFEYVQAFQ